MSDDTSSVPPTHDRRGKFSAGNNMGADIRRKRQRGIARLIGEQTRNGAEIVEAVLEILRDTGHRDRMKAADWLAKRWAGEVTKVLEVTGEDGKPLNPLHGFTAEQLLALASAKTEGEK